MAKIQVTTRIYRLKLAVNISVVTYTETFSTSYLYEIGKYIVNVSLIIGIVFTSISGLHISN